MLPIKSNQEGKTLVLVIIGVFIVVLVIGLFFMSGGKYPQTTSLPTKSDSQSVSDGLSWATFNNPSLRVALNYPSSYFFEDVTKSSTKLKPALAVNFAPKDENIRESDSIFLTVYPKGIATSASSWVLKNTTVDSREQSASVSTYLYYDVSQISEFRTQSIPVVTYLQSFPDTTAQLTTTVFATDTYIFLLSHTEGNVDEIYQKMLSSLTY